MEDTDAKPAGEPACRFEDGRCLTHEVALRRYHEPMADLGDAYCPTARDRELASRRSARVRSAAGGV